MPGSERADALVEEVAGVTTDREDADEALDALRERDMGRRTAAVGESEADEGPAVAPEVSIRSWAYMLGLYVKKCANQTRILSFSLSVPNKCDHSCQPNV